MHSNSNKVEKSQMKRYVVGILVTLALLTGVHVVGNAAKAITIKGSDTMVILGQRWAEVYMSKTPGAVIQVTGGGSGTGIAALINGTTDVCQASRPMKTAERTKLKERYFTIGTEIAVAKDGLTVYLHESNPLKQLTLEQLKGIYVGDITNWKDVGGEDKDITVYGREKNSGTYVFFKDNVLMGDDFSPMVATLPGTASVVNAVSKDPTGVGYGGAAYGKGIKFCPIAATAADSAYTPDAEHVGNGKYPLARDLYWYLRNKPEGDIKKLVEWVLSPDGQAVVTSAGYFPVQTEKK
jgi:phosphate transport system substrate-binding protein